MTIIAFQGVNGAYSEEAIYQHFGADVEVLPSRHFVDLFESVESGRADYGALPIENSTAGSINQAYDLLLERDLRIWGEIILRVRHALLVAPGTQISGIRRVR